MPPNKVEHNSLLFWSRNNILMIDLKKKACGKLMQLWLHLLEKRLVLVLTSLLKAKDFLREKPILSANATGKQRAINKWSKIWHLYLQLQEVKQKNKLKESNLLCTTSRSLLSTISPKNWLSRTPSNSWLFSLKHFKMETSTLRLLHWRPFLLSFPKSMTPPSSPSTAPWCHLFLMSLLLFYNKMKHKDKQVLRLWLSSLLLTVTSGRIAFQNLLELFLKLLSTKISRRLQEAPLLKSSQV